MTACWPLAIPWLIEAAWVATYVPIYLRWRGARREIEQKLGMPADFEIASMHVAFRHGRRHARDMRWMTAFAVYHAPVGILLNAASGRSPQMFMPSGWVTVAVVTSLTAAGYSAIGYWLLCPRT